MRISTFLLISLCLFFDLETSTAQVEGVFVERYYVSDSLDATDTIGGRLPVGSVTYRVFVDMAPGSKLLRVFGDAGHQLEFTTSTTFFNHQSDGQTFGKDFSKARYGENTVGLDSWITLGQVTRNSTKTYFGVPKSKDSDGSFIGGQNNDGGSAMVPGGLLRNADASAGIPLTVSDGNDTMSTIPSNWYSNGFVDPVTGADTTAFGSSFQGSTFISHDAFLANSGVSGKDSSNTVLVAQLTTDGILTFKMNVLVRANTANGFRDIAYVWKLAPGETNTDSLRSAPSLAYPPSCGCTDPHYIEYSSDYACSNSDSCRTLVVFGCTDTSACNYDPAANYHLPSLCCYPGYCNDRSLAVVCPSLSQQRKAFDGLAIFPNPAENELLVQWTGKPTAESRISIIDISGSTVFEKPFFNENGAGRLILDVIGLAPGIYDLRIISNEVNENKLFFKQ